MAENTTKIIVETYAETQERINGPYVPTNFTLTRCWELDEGNDTDWQPYRDNATPEELEVFERGTDDEKEALAATITARVLAQGWYTRDSKITREIREA